MTTPIPVSKTPLELFNNWYAEAQKLTLPYTNAMTVATVDETGQPHVRTVLLKGHDERGFVFYTNFQGDKGRQILAHPKAALCFYWQELGKQIRIAGPVEQVSDEEADAYYNSRPHLSRIGAWASNQSQEIEGRHVLEARVKELEAQYPGDNIPRPPHWSGFRVLPHRVEFWQEGAFRLHDRLVYTRDGDGWRTAWLSP